MSEQVVGFSALQRAEIAEIVQDDPDLPASYEVSVLFNEPKLLKSENLNEKAVYICRFSALQRAEIAEIAIRGVVAAKRRRFSALQRAEIAEINTNVFFVRICIWFQCSSTSRNC